MNRRQIAATVALPLASLAAVAFYLLAVQSRLPDPVAVHWTVGGEADGFVSPQSLAPMFAALTALLLALLTALALGSSGGIGGRPLLGLANGAGWLMVALAVTTTVGQIDQDRAGTLPVWAIPVSLVAGIAGWATAAWIAGPVAGPPPSTAPGPADARRLDLAEDHTAVWHGRTPVGVGPLSAAAAIVAALTIVASTTSWWLLVAVVPAALAVVASASYRITVGPSAVDVSGPFVGYPRVRIPLAQIARADTGAVKALSYGGWGLRIRSRSDSAVVTRSGPALVIERTDGSTLRISLDEPEVAAATVTTLLDRRAEPEAATPC